MKTHAIVELEEGALNVVVGTRDGRAVRVLKSLRVPAPDLGRDALTTLLRSLGGDALQGVTGVHVVFGDRRTHHFVSTVPRMPPADVVAFVVREALRLSGGQSALDLMVATRHVRTPGTGMLVTSTTALAKGVWEPLRLAFEASNVPVLGLHSMEECLALAARADEGPVAVLECNGSRARFVLCDGGCPVQVRRFLVGSDGNAETLVAQLAMELPRTLDWLRETGQPLPTTLVLGSRIDVGDADLDALRVDPLRSVVSGRSPVVVADGMPMPGLGVGMLLHRLCLGTPMPSLLDPPGIVLPVGAGRKLLLAGACVAGLACAWSAFVDGQELLDLRTATAAARVAGERLEAEVDALHEAAGVAAPDGQAEVLQRALRLRRPTSRLVAEVSGAVAPGLVLDRVDFASTERVVVTGVVGGSSRQEALATLAVFSRRLRDLPYLVADGSDEVGEAAGQRQRNRYRFRLGFAWRNS